MCERATPVVSKPDITLRIIGGNWRSRKVSFPDRPGLRPTPDRVRETLFNWLQFDVAGARCLELYAGSGVLGMEALSRGAGFVTLVESDPVCMAAIRANLALLGADPGSYETAPGTAEAWIKAFAGAPYDIVLLDPPYRQGRLPLVLADLCARGVIAQEGKCYIESGTAVDPAWLPEGLTLSRQKGAGQVHYCMAQWQPHQIR
jgi:16S rRNA (guanine966-N2)-methyltransferase